MYLCFIYEKKEKMILCWLLCHCQSIWIWICSFNEHDDNFSCACLNSFFVRNYVGIVHMAMIPHWPRVLVPSRLREPEVCVCPDPLWRHNNVRTSNTQPVQGCSASHGPRPCVGTQSLHCVLCRRTGHTPPPSPCVCGPCDSSELFCPNSAQRGRGRRQTSAGPSAPFGNAFSH